MTRLSANRVASLIPIVLLVALVAACGAAPPQSPAGAAGPAGLEAALPPPDEALLRPGEVHLRNIRQLTQGGENAEAYWSADGGSLIFQAKLEGMGCDQIFVMDLSTRELRRVSTGEGATTCSYFFPDGERILYSSTHLGAPECPPPPDYSRGYVWKLHPTHDIFSARSDGSDVRRLTDHPDYDAEATVSTDGSRIIFTSLRDGDLDLYTMRPDGTDVQRLTHELGYDGGAFFSRDGKRIVWRASRPKTDAERAEYLELLREHAIRPMVLEIFVADADGSAATQVTHAGAASFGPYFFPDGRRIIFSSNLADPGGRNFDLFMVNDDGSGLEQVTFDESFDGFPMFSPDGRRLVFASNRNSQKRGDTNLFLADWVD